MARTPSLWPVETSAHESGIARRSSSLHMTLIAHGRTLARLGLNGNPTRVFLARFLRKILNIEFGTTESRKRAGRKGATRQREIVMQTSGVMPILHHYPSVWQALGMAISTLTDKGQTTVPGEIRDALKLKPRQRLEWTIREDGTAMVQAQPSALSLFGSLRSPKKFPGRKKEREAAMRSIAEHANKPSER